MTAVEAAPRSAPTVAEAMVTIPKLLPCNVTRSDLDAFFENDHVHAALLMDGTRLVTVIERGDVHSAPHALEPRALGGLRDRIAHPDTNLDSAWAAMRMLHRRRLAVVDDDGVLLGLLCLKKSGDGFCTDRGVTNRAKDRAKQLDRSMRASASSPDEPWHRSVVSRGLDLHEPWREGPRT